VSRGVDDPPGENAAERADGPTGDDGGDRPDGPVEHLQARLRRLEQRFEPEVSLLRHAEKDLILPAWRRVTQGEPRWPVSVAILAAVAMQLALPDRVALHPRGLLPGLEALLLIGLIAANPRRIDRESPPLRAASLLLIAVMSLANAFSAARLVIGLVQGTEGQDAGPLLITGAAIWLTNVIVFSLWYWELDRGGPVARAHASHAHPDFLFPQMQSPELAPSDWEPGFVDYLYLSFTNATAFSPTDVLPLSSWAKLTMMLQSIVSLATVALVIARAVNILK
jgi:uncharacterized membrane protein